MRKMNLAKTLCGVLVGTAVLTACVDDKYDLGNLDGTVQIGQGRFALPTSDVDSIKLSNLFDIDEGSSIEERADGSYFVNTDGNADPTTIEVSVDVPKPEMDPFAAKLEIDAPSLVKADGPRKDPVEISYDYILDDAAKADFNKYADVSSDVISIEKVSFNDNVFNLSVTISGDPYHVIEAIHFSGMTLYLPKGLDIKEFYFNGSDNLLTTQELKDKAKNDGIIEISQLAGEKATLNLLQTSTLNLSLVIDGAKIFSTNANGEAMSFVAGSNGHDGRATLKGQIKLGGKAHIGNKDLNKTTLLSHYTGAPITDGDYTKALKQVVPSLNFNGTPTFSQAFNVTKFTGKIRHSINSINPVELNDLPDFLTEDGVSLDLANPQIFLQLTLKSPNDGVHKPFRQKLSTSVQLDAFRTGIASATGTANTGEFVFNVTDASHCLSEVVDGNNVESLLIRVCNQKNGAVPASIVPEEMSRLAPYQTDVPVKDLNTLLTTVPDRVEVKGGNSNNIVVSVDCEDAELPLKTTIEFAYTVYTPLTFGPTFTIVYTDSEDGWAEDMEDMEDLDFGSIEISATAVSNEPVPLDMNITAEAMAVDGSVIPELIINTVKIPASSMSAPITLTITPKAGKKMRDFFRGENGVKKLDGLKYKATMNNATQGAALKSSQYITLKNMKITLVGGITYYDED